MSKLSRVVLFFVIIFVLAACGNQEEEPLPTLAIVPSATVTDTPTITPTPSPTLTFTPTITPSPTDTPTITLSPTSTLTFTPTVSKTPTLTMTFTQTHTPTATDTPTQSATPTATETPSIPIINFFQSNVAQAIPGTQVTLRWSASADVVQLLLLQTGTNTAIQTFSVAAVGSQIVTLPTSGSQAQYRIVAQRGGQQTTSDLFIQFTCSQNWFFNVAAPGGGCPDGSAQNVDGSFQPFERGVMFMYENRNNDEKVCGLQNDQNRYLCYNNGWDGSTEVDIPGGPPSGFDEPDDMFNWMFDNTLASGGSWVDKIGWATSGSPNNNDVRVQYDDQGRLYIRLPSGTYFLNGTNSSGVWTKIE